MKESVFEKIRNKLSPVFLYIEATKYGTDSEENSLLQKAYNNIEKVKELVDKAEKQYGKDG